MTTADQPLIEKQIRCPYCGESISVLLDLSAGGQSYIEDCQVCCRPMEIAFHVDDEQRLTVTAEHAG